nr:retrotransposon protein, putative, unclassified [Tanacetum cinerariifolium]
MINTRVIVLAKGLKVGSIRRIQWIGYGVLEFLRVGITLDIFQNIILLYFQYGVLVFTGYDVLSLFPLWSLLEGFDVDETFSPVVKSGTIQTVLSVAASRHWPIHQVDVKNAFLHGDLSETVYMHQPPGFWTRDRYCFLLLYVDDIILTAYSENLLQQIIRSLHQEFAMTDQGPLNYFLGISVTRDSSGLFLSQKKYAIELLDRANIDNCNPSQTPIDTESKLRSDGDSVSDLTLHRSLADWVGYPTTRCSTSEAEYRGVANAVARTCWLRNLLRELYTPLSSVTLVYCDNVSAVYLSCNPVQHQRMKHNEIDIHFVRDLVAAGQVGFFMCFLVISLRIFSPRDYRPLYLKNFAPV